MSGLDADMDALKSVILTNCKNNWPADSTDVKVKPLRFKDGENLGYVTKL